MMIDEVLSKQREFYKSGVTLCVKFHIAMLKNYIQQLKI